ncbi:MAG: pitrilysin family protein [Candidatus Electryonea clarkiae]|nr:pitrilysin family protein [Candidatus Electryonea clarkiae]
MKTKENTIRIMLSLGILLLACNFVIAEEDFDPVPAYTPSGKLDPSPMQLPKFIKKNLKNGLTIYYVPQHELPVVSIRLLIPTGQLYSPMDKPGLVSFMADLITEGTENRTSTQMAEEIDFVGGSINSGSGWNAIYIQSSVLTRDIDLALELVSDCAIKANFPEEEIERLRPQIIAGIMQDKDSPSAIAGKQYAKFVYGDHPYGMPGSGSEESVGAFTRDEITGQYKNLVAPNQAILAVSGDIDWKKAHKLVKKYFTGWKKRTTKLAAIGDPVMAPGGEILLVDKTDAVQSEVRMGYVCSPYYMGKDQAAFSLMNYIFGAGGFSSRMMLRIRNDLGLVYDTRSNISSKQKKGAYTFSASTGTETTGQVIEEIYGLMKTAIKDGFTEKELQDAKAFLIGKYPARFETPQQLATQFQTALMFDVPDPQNYIETYRQRMAAVTLDEINAMAKKYLQPENIRMTVVGKADEVTDQLSPFGNVKTITLDDL